MRPSLTLCCLLLATVLAEAARKPKKPPVDVNRTDKSDQAGGKGDQAEGKGDQAEGKGDKVEGKGDKAEGKGDKAEGKGDQAAEKGQQAAEKSKEATRHVTTPQTLARGWGDEIDWVQTYEEALAITRSSKKPLMVIHHLDECPYSQALKKVFVADPVVQRMAKEDFVMLNVVHPISDANLAPDGHYVPRIMFVDPSLTVRTDIAGRYGNRMYAYESDDIPELITSMKKAKVLLHTEL